MKKIPVNSEETYRKINKYIDIIERIYLRDYTYTKKYDEKGYIINHKGVVEDYMNDPFHGKRCHFLEYFITDPITDYELYPIMDKMEKLGDYMLLYVDDIEKGLCRSNRNIWLSCGFYVDPDLSGDAI